MSLKVEPVAAEVLNALDKLPAQPSQLDLREFQKIASGAAASLGSLVPLLPVILRLKGKPYTLERHYPFEPVFSLFMPRRSIVIAGRQCGKSASLGARSVATTAALPYFNTLHITPLFEQIKRFSHQYVGPYIESSPIKKLLVSPSISNSVLQRSFLNGSTMFFSFAYLDAERVRGLAIDRCQFDEIQGIDQTFLPVIESTTDGSEQWRIIEYAGTPLTLDNTIETLFQQSSQAEWCIKCHHAGCGHINIPALGYDLLAMIGKYRDDISPESPGLVCGKCRKPIDTARGRWWHAYPERQHEFAGYHIPQIIMPSHSYDKERWAYLVGRMIGKHNTAPHQFYNEVCGVSYDTGTKLVSLSQMRAAACLPWENEAKQASARIEDYPRRILGVDWSGTGGDGSQSFTTLAVCGMTPEGKVDVLWGYRVNRMLDYDYETDLIRSVLKTFKIHAIAHDFNGVGSAREGMLVMRGVPVDRIMPIVYTAPQRAGLMAFKMANAKNPRAHYTLDKARSLHLLCTAIRLGQVRFFRWDAGPGQSGLLQDFLALKEEVMERPSNMNLFQVTRSPNSPDDFAHAVNFGACCLWYPKKWPNLGESAVPSLPTDSEFVASDEAEKISLDEWLGRGKTAPDPSFDE